MLQHVKGRTEYCAIAGAVQRLIQVYYMDCNFIGHVNGHHDPGSCPAFLRSINRSGESGHTAFGSCDNCLAHGLPLVVHRCCRIIFEDSSCEVARSKCLSGESVVWFAVTYSWLSFSWYKLLRTSSIEGCIAISVWDVNNIVVNIFLRILPNDAQTLRHLSSSQLYVGWVSTSPTT